VRHKQALKTLLCHVTLTFDPKTNPRPGCVGITKCVVTEFSDLSGGKT